jgi:predicted nuclease of predicted toxin-antitoxin system
MRLLIDECVDEDLRLLFPGHDCQTARFAKLAGLKNGRLLEAAEEAGFEVLITVDQSIPDQQDLAGRKIALLILRGPNNRLRDLARLVPSAISALRSIERGDVVRIG